MGRKGECDIGLEIQGVVGSPPECVSRYTEWGSTEQTWASDTVQCVYSHRTGLIHLTLPDGYYLHKRPASNMTRNKTI